MKQKIKLRVIKTKYDFDILDIHLDGNAHIKMLKDLRIPKFDNKRGILLNGRAPVWLFLFLFNKLVKRNILYTAVFDPKVGGIVIRAKKKAGITDKIKISRLVPYINVNPVKTKVIAFFGPPHSGKTVFMTALFKRLLNEDYAFFNRNALIVKGTPDGEGIWASEIDMELVKAIRYKNNYTDKFIREVTGYLKTAVKTKPIIFVDCGGLLDKSKEKIAQYSTHSIIVSNDGDSFDGWRKVSSNLKIISEVESKLGKKTTNKANTEIKPVKLLMTDLERENRNVFFPENFIEYIIKYLKE